MFAIANPQTMPGVYPYTAPTKARKLGGQFKGPRFKKVARPATVNGVQGTLITVWANRPSYRDGFQQNTEVDTELGDFFSEIFHGVVQATTAPLRAIANPKSVLTAKFFYSTDPLQSVPILHRTAQVVGPIASYFIPYVGPVIGPLLTAGAAASKQKDIARNAQSAIDTNNQQTEDAINQIINAAATPPATVPTSTAPIVAGGGGGVASNPVAQIEQTVAGWTTTQKWLAGGAVAGLLYLLIEKPKDR